MEQPDNLPFALLFCDGEALIIDKPAGLDVTQPRRGGRSLDDYLEVLSLGFSTLPTVLHRLDKDTSGCLMLARGRRSMKRFHTAFSTGMVEKHYLAIMVGVPQDSAGQIDAPLAKISSAEAGWRMVVDPDGKAAHTGWTVLAVRDGHSLVRFSPTTGRTHQLRVHAASVLGTPIYGDPHYGVDAPGGMMLHAWSLKVERAGKPPVEAIAPWPERFSALGFGPEDIAGPAAAA